MKDIESHCSEVQPPFCRRALELGPHAAGPTILALEALWMLGES